MNYQPNGYIALVTVLIVSAVVLTITASVALLGIGEAQSSLAGSKGEYTLQFVEGCAEDALLKAQQSSSYNGGNIIRPEGTCVVSVAKSGNNWTLTVTAADTNLVANPGCETNTSGWGGWQATVSRTTSFSHSGAASCNVTDNTSGATYYTLDDYPDIVSNPVQGQQYTATAWVRPNNLIGGEHVWLAIKMGGGTHAFSTFYSPMSASQNNTWQFLTNTQTVDYADRTNLEVYIVQDGGASVGDTFQADDITLKPINSGMISAADYNRTVVIKLTRVSGNNIIVNSWQENSPIPTPTPPPPFIVYDDQLENGFANWTFASASNANLANTSPVYSGTKSIAWTPSAGGGLKFHSGTAYSLSNYTTIHFEFRASSATQLFNLYLYGPPSNDTIGNQVSLTAAKYGGAFTAGSWRVYDIPLSDLGLSNQTFTDFIIQEATGNAQSAVYVDDVQFQ